MGVRVRPTPSPPVRSLLLVQGVELFEIILLLQKHVFVITVYKDLNYLRSFCKAERGAKGERGRFLLILV